MQDQLSESLSQLQVAPYTAQSFNHSHQSGLPKSAATHPDNSPDKKAANEVHAASTPLPESHSSSEQNPAPAPLISAEQTSAGDHADAATSAYNASGGANDGNRTQPDFQTPQSRVQSQLAGLKRRAARKQSL